MMKFQRANQIIKYEATAPGLADTLATIGGSFGFITIGSSFLRIIHSILLRRAIRRDIGRDIEKTSGICE